MKDPIGAYGCRWGFSALTDAGSGFLMPIWMEMLLNVVGYAGFVAVANLNPHVRQTSGNKARGEDVS